MNAKEEFLRHIDGRKVKCVTIDPDPYYEEKSHIQLKINYTEEDYKLFLDSLDYDSGYGTQELEGVVWYEDGTWSERGEYDGSEWWRYCSVPVIPKKLR